MFWRPITAGRPFDQCTRSSSHTPNSLVRPFSKTFIRHLLSNTGNCQRRWTDERLFCEVRTLWPLLAKKMKVQRKIRRNYKHYHSYFSRIQCTELQSTFDFIHTKKCNFLGGPIVKYSVKVGLYIVICVSWTKSEKSDTKTIRLSARPTRMLVDGFQTFSNFYKLYYLPF